MGMSNDYEIAVEEGATMVADRKPPLFGARGKMIDESFHLTPLDVRRYDFRSAPFAATIPARVDQFRDQVAEEMGAAHTDQSGSRLEGEELSRAAPRVFASATKR